MQKYKMHSQYPLDETGIAGTLTIDKGEAYFGGDDGSSHKLQSAEVMWISMHGIYVRGYEKLNIDAKGRDILKPQEWYCKYQNSATIC